MLDIGISLGGFSGIDTDSMIQQLMWIEQAPIRNMESKQNELNNQVSAWQEINTQLDTLKSKAEELLTDNVTSLDNAFENLTSSSSDEDIVTASVDSSASAGTYDIDITQLAQAHRVASDSAESITGTAGADANTALGLTNSGTFTLSVGGTNIQIGDDNTIDGNTTLNDLKDFINNDSENEDADGNQLVEASIVDNQLVLESVNGGSSNKLSIVSDADNVLSDIGFTDFSDTGADTIQQAQDANFTVNSVSVTRETNEIDDVIEGVTFNLKDAGSATIEISKDKEGIQEKVQGFIDQYNTIIDKIGKYGGKEGTLQGDASLGSLESRLYNSVIFPSNTVSSTDILDNNPLTGSGTLQVSADGVTDSVTFNGGEDLTTIASDIKSFSSVSDAYVEDDRLVIEGINGEAVDLSGSSSQLLKDLELPENFEKNTASLLGISIDKNGKLSLNEDDFNEALDSNLSDLKQMFTGVNGVVDRVTEEVDNAVSSFTINGNSYDGYIEGRIDSLQNEISYIDNNIASVERRLEIREENLRQQFTRMETAISEMQNQGSWLSSQVGSMGLSSML